MLGLIILGILICGFWHLSPFDTNMSFDIVATLIALGLIVFVAIFYTRKPWHRKSYWVFPSILIATILIILFGAVIYNPRLETLPIDSIKINNCEICFNVAKAKEGQKFCSKDGVNKYLQYIHESPNKTIAKDNISKDYKSMFQLVCSETPEKFVRALEQIKKEKIEAASKDKNIDPNVAFWEVILLDEFAIGVLANAPDECKKCENK